MSKQVPLLSVSFVIMIQATSDLLGRATTAVLRDTGKVLGQSKAKLDELQGESKEIRPGIFVQKECPFAEAVSMLKDSGIDLPEALKTLADEANRKGAAWVSAFCGVHQSMRAAKHPDHVHIACKAGDGSINYAEQDIMEKSEIDEILADAACIYAAK